MGIAHELNARLLMSWWREMDSNQRYGFPYCLARSQWGPGLNAEFARFWCSRWSVMNPATRNAIESNILAGPEGVKGDAEGIRDRAIYRELTRIASWDGNVLSERAAGERAAIASRIAGLPERIGVTERLVSSSWSGMGRFGDTSSVQGVPADGPLERVQAIEQSDPFNQGELWDKLCEEDPARAFEALEVAARTGEWPKVRWASFLSFGALSTDPPGPDVGHLLHRIGQMPDDVMREILPYLTSCTRRRAYARQRIRESLHGRFIQVRHQRPGRTRQDRADSAAARETAEYPSVRRRPGDQDRRRSGWCDWSLGRAWRGSRRWLRSRWPRQDRRPSEIALGNLHPPIASRPGDSAKGVSVSEAPSWEASFGVRTAGYVAGFGARRDG